MPHSRLSCPYAATTVRFKAYVATFDYEHIPDCGAPNIKHLMKFRFEDQNPFLARTKALSKIRKIKWALDQVEDDPNEKFQYQGVKLWMEYQIEQPFINSEPEIRFITLLDGETGTIEDLRQRLSSEEFLLDVLGFSFVSVDIEANDKLEYSQLVDTLFDGLVALEKN